MSLVQPPPPLGPDTAPEIGLRAAQWRGAAALAEREVVRVLRLWTQTIAAQVVSGLLFVVIFGVALSTRIRPVSGVPYEQFIVPGLVLMGVATATYANTASSLYQARFDGFIDDPVSGPMGARHLLVAYLAGGVARGIVIGGLTLAAARAVVTFPVTHAAYAGAALLIVAVAFSALGVIVGLYASTWDQQAFVGNLVIQPLVLLGGVFYSIDLLGEPWRSLTRADPILYMVDAARYGLLGVADHPPAASLAGAAALAALLVAWAWALFARGTGLRT